MGTTRHPNNMISQRLYHLHDMDIKRLRNLYRRSNEDVPHHLLMTASRKVMADRIAVDEFGAAAVDHYYDCVSIWKEMQALVEGKISGDEPVKKKRGRKSSK